MSVGELSAEGWEGGEGERTGQEGPCPGDLPDPGTELGSLALAGRFFSV